MEWLTLAIAVSSVLFAARAVSAANRSASAAEESLRQAFAPRAVLHVRRDERGFTTLELVFDRDLDRAEISMVRADGDRDILAFDGLHSRDPSLANIVGANDSSTILNVAAGHPYWLEPHLFQQWHDHGRVILRCVCTVGKHQWTTVADSGRFDMKHPHL